VVPVAKVKTLPMGFSSLKKRIAMSSEITTVFGLTSWSLMAPSFSLKSKTEKNEGPV